MVAPLNPQRPYGEIRQSMSGYLPTYYEGSRIVGNLLNVEGAEVASLNANIADVLAQFYIDTATWGLANWERICGIETDAAKPIDQRRSVIKSKLRGVGTVTVTLIKNVAEAYANGEVEVTEDNSHYNVVISFVSEIGRPINFADVQNALREIIPAHLNITYTFRYLTVNEVHNTITISTLQTTQLNKFAPFV